MKIIWKKKKKMRTKKTVPSRRTTNPRRLVSRARSKSAPVFRANTSSRPRTSFRNNQRLRVRGGGRRSTEAPETTKITERHAVVSSTVKNDFEDETEKSLEGKFTTVDVEGLEDPATVVEPVHTTEGVDSTLTINIHEETTEVVGSTVTEEVSTLRPKKFKPKFGSATRDKLRERLREQLINNKTKSVEVETSEVNESEDEEKLPTEDSEKDMPDDILTTDSPKFEPKFGSSTRDKLREQLREQLESEKLKKEDTGDPANEPVFDSAFSDFDITSQKEAPTTARISFDKENFIEIEEVSPSQPQRRSQRRISHKTAQGPLVTRVRSRNQLRKRSNNSHLRHRKRSQSYNTINQQIHRVQKQRRGKSASSVFYDPRRGRRQPIKTEPITESINFDDKLFRVGRSTIVDSQMINGPGEGHQTDANILATTSMDSTAEETTQKMATIEEQETSMTDETIVTDPTTVDQFKDTATEPIVEEEENDNVPFKPFLLRSGKKEKSIFKDRYKDNILSRLRSKNELKSSGSNIQNRFSRFRPGLPSLGNKEHDEKVSGPNIDPSKGIQIIKVETHDEQTEKNDTTIKKQEKNDLSLKQKEKSKFSKHKSNLFSRKKSKGFENVTETTTTFPSTTSQSISQNKTTEKLDISKKPSNIFAHAKRAKFKSKYTQQFGKKRSSLFKHKPSVEKISTESVKPNISLDSDSVTSSNITSTPSNLSSDQTESFSPKPNPPKSSSSPSFPSSPTRKRFKFSTGSKKSPLTNLFNRRNKHKNSQILSRLTTSTTPSEETTLSSAQEEKSSRGGEDVNNDEASTPFQPTVSDNLISTDASTQAPFFPTFVPVDTEQSKTTPASVILITEAPQEQPRRDNPRRLEIFNLQNQNELTDNKSSDPESVRLGTHANDDKSISREQALFKDAQDNSRSSEVPQRSSRPFVGRPLRPVPSRNQDASSRQRSSSIQRSRSRSRAPAAATSPKPTTRFETSFEPSEPEQLASPVQPSRVLSPEDLVQALVQSPSPDTRVASQQFSQSRRTEEDSLVQRGRPQINPFDKIPVPQNTRNRDLVRPAAVALPVQPASDDEFEYEYYYDYLDDDHDKPNSDYDLVPLANKVRIQADGLPHCLDVGVFPHPFSCKKFVNCFRNPGTGIVGSIYQCPSYLAFDPVGGRCNWVNEIVRASRK